MKRLSVIAVLCQGLLLACAKLPEFETYEQGHKGTKDYAMYFKSKNGAKTISPWHEIQLHMGPFNLNYVNEIPKGTTAKMEVNTREEANPIKQDIQGDQLRYLPFNQRWNYGMLPQTWEDPHRHIDYDLRAVGDNDPVDVVEIGSATHAQGSVHEVKPLCALAMVDEGKMDWKIIVIDNADPDASMIDGAASLEKHRPTELESIRQWFKDYKAKGGGSPVEFGYGGKCLDGLQLVQVVSDSHQYYMDLKSGRTANIGNLSLI